MLNVVGPQSLNFLLLVTTFLLLGVHSSLDPQDEEQEMERTTLLCNKRKYILNLRRDFTFNNGTRIVRCRASARVDVCWGRCDTSEVSMWHYIVLSASGAFITCSTYTTIYTCFVTCSIYTCSEYND